MCTLFFSFVVCLTLVVFASGFRFPPTHSWAGFGANRLRLHTSIGTQKDFMNSNRLYAQKTSFGAGKDKGIKNIVSPSINVFPQRVPLSQLKVGDEVCGKITSIRKYGMFLDVGATKNGFLHIKDISEEDFTSNIMDKFAPGQSVKSYVKFVDPDACRLGLQMIPFSPAQQKPRINWKALAPGDAINGTVVKSSDYGVFVEIGAPFRAFLHRTKMKCSRRHRHLRAMEVCPVGSEVLSYVYKVHDGYNRIELTTYPPSEWEGVLDIYADEIKQDKNVQMFIDLTDGDSTTNKKNSKSQSVKAFSLDDDDEEESNDDEDDDDEREDGPHSSVEVLSPQEIQRLTRRDVLIDDDGDESLLHDLQSRNAKQSTQDEDEPLLTFDDVKSMFTEISEGFSSISWADVRDWRMTRYLMKIGGLSEADLKAMYLRAGALRGKLSLQRFPRFLAMLEKAFKSIKIDESQANETKEVERDDDSDFNNNENTPSYLKRVPVERFANQIKQTAKQQFAEVSGGRDSITLEDIMTWDVCVKAMKSRTTNVQMVTDMFNTAIRSSKSGDMGLVEFAFFLDMFNPVISKEVDGDLLLGLVKHRHETEKMTKKSALQGKRTSAKESNTFDKFNGPAEAVKNKEEADDEDDEDDGESYPVHENEEDEDDDYEEDGGNEEGLHRGDDNDGDDDDDDDDVYYDDEAENAEDVDDENEEERKPLQNNSGGNSKSSHTKTSFVYEEEDDAVDPYYDDEDDENMVDSFITKSSANATSEEKAIVTENTKEDSPSEIDDFFYENEIEKGTPIGSKDIDSSFNQKNMPERKIETNVPSTPADVKVVERKNEVTQNHNVEKPKVISRELLYFESVFNKLAKGKTTVEVDDILKWDTVRNMIKVGMLKIIDVSDVVSILSPKTKKLDFNGFLSFSDLLNDVYSSNGKIRHAKKAKETPETGKIQSTNEKELKPTPILLPKDVKDVNDKKVVDEPAEKHLILETSEVNRKPSNVSTPGLILWPNKSEDSSNYHIEQDDEEDDDDGDYDGETEDVEEVYSGGSEEEETSPEDMEYLSQTFNELAGQKGFVDYKDLMKWDAVKEMIEMQLISREDILQTVGLLSPERKLDFNAFLRLCELMEDVYGEADPYEEDDESEESSSKLIL